MLNSCFRNFFNLRRWTSWRWYTFPCARYVCHILAPHSRRKTSSVKPRL